MFIIVFSENAKKDVKLLNKRFPKAMEKLYSLLAEIEQHPTEGTGKVERLKGYGENLVYSRRIDSRNRLVYAVVNSVVKVFVVSAFGHYDNKADWEEELHKLSDE